MASPPPPLCIEPGCDRPASEGDERCALHQVRLGARPSRPSAPRSAPPAIVEHALDASVAIAPSRGRRPRDYWLGLAGWGLGSAGFFGGGALHLGRSIGGNLELVFVLLWFASGGLATYGAGRSSSLANSKAKFVLSVLLLLVTGLPIGLVGILMIVGLISSL